MKWQKAFVKRAEEFANFSSPSPTIKTDEPDETVDPKFVTVAELINFLVTQPQDLFVAYQLHSEQSLLQLSDIKIEEHCYPRPDGWIQNKRPDMPSHPYLILPGN